MGIGFTGGLDQSEVADGIDESNGRWVTLLESPLRHTQPDGVAVGGSGATPKFEPAGATLYSDTVGHDGYLSVMTVGSQYATYLSTGTLLLTYLYGGAEYTHNGIENLSDKHFFGLIRRDEDDVDNIAAFRPHIGNNTAGNVRVDSDGINSDGSISYPDINEMHTYRILIDYAGYYNTAGSTAFYVDSDPRVNDSADVTLSKTPNISTDTMRRYLGAGYVSNGNEQEMKVQHIGVEWRP